MSVCVYVCVWGGGCVCLGVDVCVCGWVCLYVGRCVQSFGKLLGLVGKRKKLAVEANL